MATPTRYADDYDRQQAKKVLWPEIVRRGLNPRKNWTCAPPQGHQASQKTKRQTKQITTSG